MGMSNVWPKVCGKEEKKMSCVAAGKEDMSRGSM